MIVKKTQKATQTLLKQRRHQRKPDLNLFLIRLILLGIAAALILTFVPLRSCPINFSGAVMVLMRFGVFCAALLLVFSIRKAKEWERAIVLRLGKFHKVKGPGFFFLIPLVD